MSLTIKVGQEKCDCVKLRSKVYNYERRLRNVLERVRRSPIGEEDKTSILEFYEDCLAQGLSTARIIKYLDTLERIARSLGKSFKDTTREDIAEFVRKIEASDYSEWTKHDYKLILKIFYKWLKKTEDYPEEVRWIRTKVKNNNKLPEELLTEEEIKRLVDAANNLRDKALILVLYESGCRIGEILCLEIKHVHFDNYGARLTVDGKTGMRSVRVIASAPKLAQWIDNHPLRGNPEAPLWVSLGVKNREKALSYGAAKTAIKDLARKVGIRKRVYPHLFRHSRATHLATHLTEAQMKQHFGWVQDSKMAGTYVHLSGRDIDNALLKLNGIAVEKEDEKEEFTVVICPRCETKNSPTSKFCTKCGYCFDLRTAMQLDEVRSKADKLMTELVNKPEVLDVLVEAMAKIKAQSN